MTGFVTDYVNQIATNLRDRYKTGFPILKELVQNADDAGARSIVFGFHPGHGAAADHMLLRGPALWVLNDGEFTRDDERAIRSFGLNAKAGDAGKIGKFGLGMKSVFHLCEAFFYAASRDGTPVHDILNPWKSGDDDCTQIHLDWEQMTDRDVQYLASVARAQPEAAAAPNWFLLWVPLRQRAHVPREDGRRLAAIIERYPMEGDRQDLDFFIDPLTDQRIGALLPLLRNLRHVRFASAPNQRSASSVRLELQSPESRLDHVSPARRLRGAVHGAPLHEVPLQFFARQCVAEDASVFKELRATASWPQSMVIIADQPREKRPDKAIAEAALMFAHGDRRVGRLSLQWAVFLPTDDAQFHYEATIPGTSTEYSIVLHGQFFVDAGRRGIAEMDALARRHEWLVGDQSRESDVVRCWNQAIAQELVLPKFLPTLAEYVSAVELNDEAIADLTRAIAQCAAGGEGARQDGFFKTFRKHICTRHAWVRRLGAEGPCWELVTREGRRLLPLPTPPAKDPGCLGRALPGLADRGDCITFDANAPRLIAESAEWDSALLVGVIGEVSADLLAHAADLDYLAAFLEQEAQRAVQTQQVQDVLVARLRQFLSSAPLSDVRRRATSVKRIVATLKPERVLGLGVKDPRARSALPEALLRRLLAAETSALLIPADLAPERPAASPSADDVLAWLRALAHGGERDKPAPDLVASVLTAAEQLIKAAGDDEQQASLVRRVPRLRILRVTQVDGSRSRAYSLDELLEAHRAGRVFRVKDAKQPDGFVPRLAAALPALQPVVVGRAVAGFVEAAHAPTPRTVPACTDADALLRCAGAAADAPELGSEAARKQLLELVPQASLGDPDVVQGVRYLLHGSTAHYLSSDVLWKDPAGRDSAWVRLWRMIVPSPWCVLPISLSGEIPDRSAQALKIEPVDEASVLRELHRCQDLSRVDASAFTPPEIDQFLGRVADPDAWRRLPLHRDRAGGFGALHDRCYLGAEPALPDGIGADIRFIQRSSDEAHRRRQTECIAHWTARTAAECVLREPEPGAHWRYLMHLLEEHPDLANTASSHWLKAWRGKRWLPLVNGEAIALESLVHIDGLDADISALARRCEYAFAAPFDLAAPLKAHPAFGTLRAQIASNQEGLSILGQMMSDAGLTIGACGREAFERLLPHLATLAAIECLPAWAMVKRAIDATSSEAVQRDLLPEITTQLDEASSRRVLAWLARQPAGEAEEVVFALYLGEWRRSEHAAPLRQTLPSLRLLSRADTWVPAGQLVAGAEGIAPEHAVCDAHRRILEGVIVTNDTPGRGERSEATEGEPDGASDLVRDLAEYVEPLVGSGARQAVGALLGLFGARVEALASHWLEPITYPDYLDQLGWRDPGFDKGKQRWEWMCGKTVEEALASLSIRIRVVTESEVSLPALTGELISVPLAPPEQRSSLIIKAGGWNGNACCVHLHPVDSLLSREVTEQRDVLLRTAELLLRKLYNQKSANLSGLLSLTAEADQITLDVARGMILEGLPMSLRTLPNVTNNPKLRDVLGRLDAARRAVISAGKAGRADDAPRAEQADAQAALTSLVEEDAEVQAVLLDGLRKRVARNQYEYSSIPFEVFQNADDAIVELQALQHADGREPYSAEHVGRFVLAAAEDVVRFLHWGRLINDVGRHTCARPEFGNDLEHMLMIGASAKEPNDGVTGKFGFGFKSLMLASRTPRVSSGDLSFEVVAGCLPVKWRVSEPARAFVRDAVRGGQTRLRSTLIELPLDEPALAEQIIPRFAGLAGLLPVFARAVNCVEVDGRVHRWNPRCLWRVGDCTVEVGTVMLPSRSGTNTSGVLVLRADSGCVVLRIGKAGIERFEPDAQPPVPALWVTAPTRGAPATGVLLNAAFQIDTGRATLAQTETAARVNGELVEAIVTSVTPALDALLTRSHESWSAVAESLGCTSGVSAAVFWRDLWRALLRAPTDGETAPDARLVARFGERLFERMTARSGLVPNGFDEALARFVRVSEIILAVRESGDAAVLPALRDWPTFVARYPVERWCTASVRRWLERIDAGQAQPTPELGITEVLGVLTNNQLPADDVAALARVLRAWSVQAWDERAGELAALHVQVQDGGWVPIREVLLADTEADEVLARFAPRAVTVNHAYAHVAADLAFIRTLSPCREHDPRTRASWCLEATGWVQQAAVIEWLLMHDRDDCVINCLRMWRNRGGWLFELTEDADVLQQGWFPDQCRMLLRGLGVLVESPPAAPVRGSEPRLSLDVIEGWWLDRAEHWLTRHDQRLWPSHVNRAALRLDGPSYDRAAWMTLFSLGIYQRYGRTRPEQHRAFIEFLHTRGWWETICQFAPDEGADAWIGILRDYAAERDTHGTFEEWMDSFPRLYRVANWLDDYVHLFQSVDQRDPTALNALLMPASDVSLSGSGIDAPQLAGTLRLGQHLVIRELLRVGVLSSPHAKRWAYAPRSAVVSLLGELGYPGVERSEEIFDLLASELGGDERACFGGAYDIPLQLLATDKKAEQDALKWAADLLGEADDDEDWS